MALLSEVSIDDHKATLDFLMQQVLCRVVDVVPIPGPRLLRLHVVRDDDVASIEGRHPPIHRRNPVVAPPISECG
ncbi:MAG: hypothetical protein AAGB19_21320, partial [Cyanobacteria bacterium P01_F01_bin.3]